MHPQHPSTYFRQSDHGQRTFDRRLIPPNYLQNHAHFTKIEFEIRQKLAERTRPMSQEEIERLLREVSAHAETWRPGTGVGAAAVFLLGVVILSCLSGTADARSLQVISNACTRTNLVPATRLEGISATDWDPRVGAWRFSVYSKTGTTQEREKLNKELKERENIFVEAGLREKALADSTPALKLILKLCTTRVPSTVASNHIESNVVNDVIGRKVVFYQHVKSMYQYYTKRNAGDRNKPIIGNCLEMQAQAALTILPELIPDEEFFVVVSAEQLGKMEYMNHMYGFIVPKGVLMGEGLTSPEEKKAFFEKFSQRYFSDGVNNIEMGKTHAEIQKNAALFWKGLGISGRKVVNSATASKVRLCDPYIGHGQFCDLNHCFEDSDIEQTFLQALKDIIEVNIVSYVIPKELIPKLNNHDVLLCMNNEINEMNARLIEEEVKPALKMAAKMAAEKLTKTEL